MLPSCLILFLVAFSVWLIVILYSLMCSCIFILYCSVLLGLADGELLPDPDVQKAALNVIINSVCGPMSRVD